jgi:hypothetical protein
LTAKIRAQITNGFPDLGTVAVNKTIENWPYLFATLNRRTEASKINSEGHTVYVTVFLTVG